MKSLVPDRMFHTYQALTPALLQEQGIKALLVDIDNTLAPYEREAPSAACIRWVEAMRAEGIRIALVSNNHRPRVERFNQDLGLPAFYDSGKPGKKRVKEILSALNTVAKETAVLGDQVLTDAAFGRNNGFTVFLVPPIYDKRNLFFRFKRLLEIPVIRKYNRNNKTDFNTYRLHPKERIAEILTSDTL